MSRSARMRLAAASVVATAMTATLLVTSGVAHGDHRGNYTLGVDAPDSVVVGTSVPLRSKFAAPWNGKFVVHTEVYNAADREIKEFYEVVWMSRYQSLTRSYTWRTSGLPTGRYTIKQGMFTEGWNYEVEWNDNAAQVTLTTGTTSSTSPTSSSIPASTSTSTTVKPTTTSSTSSTTMKPTTTIAPTTSVPPAPQSADLNDPTRKARAAMITSSFENSDLRIDYAYAENIGDGRGITAGRAGFTSGTGDLLMLVEKYTAAVPSNGLAKYLPALRSVNGTSSTSGLSGFESAFATEDAGVNRAKFRKAQDELVDYLYFNPAMTLASAVGVKSALGQAIFWDTAIQHGLSNDAVNYQPGKTVNWSSIGSGDSMDDIVKETRAAMGGNVNGNEVAWINKFLELRLKHLLEWSEEGDQFDESSQSRVGALRSIVQAGKLDLSPTFSWTAYGDRFTIDGIIQNQQFND